MIAFYLNVASMFLWALLTKSDIPWYVAIPLAMIWPLVLLAVLIGE